MKNALLTIILLTSFTAVAAEKENSTFITGAQAEAIFTELEGSSEYSAGAITEFLEYRMIVRQNDKFECQKATTLYKGVNLTEVEFECTIK